MPYFGRYKYFFLLLVCGYIIISLLQLILPYLTQSIVDVGIANKDLSIITLILIAQLMLLIGATSVRMVNNWITLHISTRVSISLISDFLIRLVKSPMEFFDHKKIGDTVQRIGDHDRIENFITTQSLSLLYSINHVGRVQHRDAYLQREDIHCLSGVQYRVFRLAHGFHEKEEGTGLQILRDAVLQAKVLHIN